MDTPTLLEDGTHIIPFQRIKCAGKEFSPEVTGVVKWHPEEGVTFEVNFPDWPLGIPNLPQFAKGAGSLVDYPATPRWIGETADGLLVELFVIEERSPTKALPFGNCFKIVGKAIQAIVVLHRENPLAFWNATPEQPRAFFLGFVSYHWTKEEDISYKSGMGITYSSRRSILLSHATHVAIYEAGHRVQLSEGAWLTLGENHVGNEFPAYPPADYCNFLSFLNGYFSPIFWRDSFTSRSTLHRIYFGTKRNRFDGLNNSLPPLPLQHSVGVRFGAEVVEHLPSLFAAYLEASKRIDLGFILTPLLSAFRDMLENRLALACVSLERLAAEWSQSPCGRAIERKGKFWTPLQSCKIRKTLKKAIDDITSETQLTPDQVNVLKKRIDNLGQSTNFDKLTAVFDALKLNLSDFERKVIRERNEALHGRSILRSSSSLPEFDDEVLRFDTLRMLITKGVLGLIEYHGPYVDYAARTQDGDFPVKRLSTNKV